MFFVSISRSPADKSVVKEYPLSFDSNRHDTLLKRKAITFTPISKSNNKDPEWTRFTLEDGIKIVGKKEVRQHWPLPMLLTNCFFRH
jgi:hypothetical protein